MKSSMTSFTLIPNFYIVVLTHLILLIEILSFKSSLNVNRNTYKQKDSSIFEGLVEDLKKSV